VPSGTFPLEPTTIHVPDDLLEDLRRRLRETRWPLDVGNEDGWYGVRRTDLEDLCAYWADGYDWRAAERAINRYEPATGGYVFELVDEAGEGLNSFPIDYGRIRDGGKPSEFAHIATVLPDGSVLVVWDDAPGMARLDACGAPIWAKTRRYTSAMTQVPMAK